MLKNWIPLVGLVALVGCAHHNVALEKAQLKYNQTAQDPIIARDASVPLYEAKQTLSKAEALAKSNDNDSEVNHLSYVVERKLDVAKYTADQKRAEVTTTEANKGRQGVIIDARNKEVEITKQKADVATARAIQAEAATTEAEQNTRDVEAMSGQRTAELERQLADLKAKETKAGTQITLREMMFEVGKAELAPGGIRNLEKVATVAKQSPSREILIEGHTDSTGSDSMNMDLSRRRAQAVKDLLTQEGISADKIVAKGYGKTYPVATNKTGEGRQRNRRVEITILNEGTQAQDVKPSAQ